MYVFAIIALSVINIILGKLAFSDIKRRGRSVGEQLAEAMRIYEHAAGFSEELRAYSRAAEDEISSLRAQAAALNERVESLERRGRALREQPPPVAVADDVGGGAEERQELPIKKSRAKKERDAGAVKSAKQAPAAPEAFQTAARDGARSAADPSETRESNLDEVLRLHREGVPRGQIARQLEVTTTEVDLIISIYEG
jgi:hypothetical protein